MDRAADASVAFNRAAELDPSLERTEEVVETPPIDPREVDGSDPIIFAKTIMELVKKAHRADGNVEAAIYFPGLKPEVTGCRSLIRDSSSRLRPNLIPRM